MLDLFIIRINVVLISSIDNSRPEIKITGNRKEQNENQEINGFYLAMVIEKYHVVFVFTVFALPVLQRLLCSLFVDC